jgi:hypothetical protein
MGMRRLLMVGAITLAIAIFAAARISNAVFSYQSSIAMVPVAKPIPAPVPKPKTHVKAPAPPQQDQYQVCPANDQCAKRVVIFI